jgi:DNA-binding NtrC family response regulator
MSGPLHLRAAVVVGVAATVIALGMEVAGIAPLDAWAHARWRRPAPVSGGIVVVTRDRDDPAADHAGLARVVGRLSRAGAVAVGLDLPDSPSAGGAAAEALLHQVIAQAGKVVVPVLPSAVSGVAASARAVGHLAGEARGGVAAVPLSMILDGRAVPALGLVLASVALDADLVVEGDVVSLQRTGLRVPLDPSGRALLSPSDGLPRTSFGALWRMTEDSDTAGLQALVAGKLVVVSGEPARTPEVVLQSELANAVLTNSALRAAPTAGTWTAALALALVTAWLALARRAWIAVVDAAGLVLAVAGSVGVLLQLGVVVPLTVLVVPIAAAAVGGLGWRHVAERHRLGRLEREVRTIREALVRQESTVETLEEDLEAARAAVERSTGAERALVRVAEALRSQLGEARAQEQETRRRLEALGRESRAVQRTSEPDEACARLGILTRDPALVALFRDLEKAARSSLPILITGEPGTGKELFARAAHRLSPRAGQPFVAVNMAAIPPELFESELFGHVRGSFTGAVADRKGWFEQADHGTIFLDEVGELRADHQSKLLRVLQEKSFYRVGATRPTAVDVRIVAATNRDLERGVAEGWFREDLYFRLKGLVLALPPLRARRHDIALLAGRLLAEAAAEVKRPALALSEAAVAALEGHAWPGNVRELQNCLRQAAALAESEVLGTADLRLPGAGRIPDLDRGDTDATVLAALRRHGFDMQATARTLGWDRSTVTQRLKGLGFRALVEAGGDAARAAAELAGDAALARTVEVKLREYHAHLLRTVEPFDSADAAVAACRRRFKNLPERHFRSLESLVRRRFA